jgi:hypothetical protein
VVNEHKQPTSIRLTLVVVAALALAAGAFWFWYSSKDRPQPAAPAITAEAKTYVRHLRLGGVQMKATTNFAGATVLEIEGNISNEGDKTLDRVELNCVFYDPNGVEVLRQRVPIVRSTIKPGETRSFRLPFEGVPQTWNQTLPQLVIAHIAFSS